MRSVQEHTENGIITKHEVTGADRTGEDMQEIFLYGRGQQVLLMSHEISLRRVMEEKVKKMRRAP